MHTHTYSYAEALFKLGGSFFNWHSSLQIANDSNSPLIIFLIHLWETIRCCNAGRTDGRAHAHAADVVGLTWLKASGNLIETLEWVSQMEKMTVLNLSGNQIRELDPLVKLHTLKALVSATTRRTDLYDPRGSGGSLMLPMHQICLLPSCVCIFLPCCSSFFSFLFFFSLLSLKNKIGGFFASTHSYYYDLSL